MRRRSTLRSASAFFGFAIAVTTPILAGAANFGGSWDFRGTMLPVETIAPVCVLRQSGSVIAGSCKGPAGIGSAQGSTSGSRVVLQWTRLATSRLQNNSVVTFRGVVNGGSFSGTWTDSVFPGHAGTFAARRI